MTARTPVVMIALDAAELPLIEELCAAGELPTLQSLRRRGCFGLLESDALRFAGGVWPTFYTGKELPWHGLYHNRQWSPETMRCEPLDERWSSERPFWESLDPGRYRVAVLDVPVTDRPSRALNGVQLWGWGAHDLGARGSCPADLWGGLEREFGPPRMPPEHIGPQTVDGLQRMKQALLEATEQMATLGAALLARQAWDLFLLVLGSPHRGGHYLWDTSQVQVAGQSSAQLRALNGAPREIYRACDAALARLVERVPAAATVMVFALHGMGRNPGWSDYCPDMLLRIQKRAGEQTARTGLFYRLNRALPRGIIRAVTNRLPPNAQDWLVTRWYGSMVDWRTTRCFPLLMDHAGYLRVNLKGRESRGLVEPGPEYEALCQSVAEAFHTFRDLRTGQPVVDRVYHLDELAPPDAPYRDRLPDLVITWREGSAIDSPGVGSNEFGELRWQPAGRLPSGRSGNHRAQGWFVAVGDGIPAGSRVDGYRLIDLAPTVCRWLGAEPRADLQGRPIPPLCPAERDAVARLVVFAEDWGRHPSSCHYLVPRLLERHPTLWVNTIGTRRPGLTPDDLEKIAARLQQWSSPRRGRRTVMSNLTVISPLMWPGFRTSRQRRLNATLIARAVHRELGPRARDERRIAITTLPITADLVGRLAVDRWVYYCIDDFSVWPGLDASVMAAMERRQIELVDTVIATSEPLQQRLATYGREASLLTHGVDLAHWATRADATAGTAVRPDPLPSWWERLARPIILFWGLIDRRLDASWCRALVEGFVEGGTLLLVGPQQSPHPALRAQDRVVLPGSMPYDRLPALAAAADVLVMPYADLPVTRAMQPLKFKEYLATGKPVVARDLPATREWADAADLVGTAAEFVNAVRERVRTGAPAAQRAARRRLADESWDQKARLFEALVLDPLPREDRGEDQRHHRHQLDQDVR